MSRLPNWVDDAMRSLLIQLTAHLLINQQQGNIFISETGVILRDNFEQEHQISLIELTSNSIEGYNLFVDLPAVSLDVVPEVDLLQTVEETGFSFVLDMDSMTNLTYQEEDIVSPPTEKEWPVQLKEQLEKALRRQLSNSETLKQYYKVGQLLANVPTQHRRQLSAIKRKINRELGFQSYDRHYMIARRTYQIFSSEEEIDQKNFDLELTPTKIYHMRNREIKDLLQ